MNTFNYLTHFILKVLISLWHLWFCENNVLFPNRRKGFFPQSVKFENHFTQCFPFTYLHTVERLWRNKLLWETKTFLCCSHFLRRIRPPLQCHLSYFLYSPAQWIVFNTHFCEMTSSVFNFMPVSGI